MEIVIIVAVIVVVVLCVLAFFRREKKPDDKLAETFTAKTPLGVNLVSAGAIPEAMKNAIDESLTQLFKDARALGYVNKIDHGDYTIHIAQNCEPSPVSGTLSFRIRADEYNNSIFDVNPDPNVGEVFAAEQVIMRNNQPTPHYIICADSDLENVKRTTRYGAEHVLHFYNNLAEYERTRFHGNGVSHPIIPIT